MNFPEIRIFQWDVAEIASPVGNRTQPGGTFAFRQMVSSGCQSASAMSPSSTSGVLDFPDVTFNLTDLPLPSHIASTPVAITFNLANSGVAISDMRLFLIDDSAFQACRDQGLDPGFVQYAPSGSLWRYNLSLPSGSVQRLSTLIPSRQNVLRQDGAKALMGQDDRNSSEFIYMNVILPLGTPFGQYGVCGSGLLRFGLIFNYWSNSFVIETGLEPG